MNEEIREGMKLVAQGTKKGTKAVLIAFKNSVDKFVDTVTDDKFEEKIKAETQALADNFNKELKEIKDKIDEMSKEAAKEYKEEVDEYKEQIKEAIDDAAEEIKNEVDE